MEALEELEKARGHLVKAKEKLAEEPPSRAVWSAIRYTRYATNYVRYALKRLGEQEEENGNTKV